MLRSLINDAKAAAGAVITKYALRASVAVPFVIGIGFAIASVAVILVEQFGAAAGYGIMAGGFAAIGLVAALLVGVREHGEEVADAEAEKTDTANVASDAAVQAAVQLPLVLIGTLLTTPFGPTAAAKGTKLLARNFPLALLLVFIGFLLWPSRRAEGGIAATDAAEPDAHAPPPRHPSDQAPWHTGNGLDQRAT